MCLYIGNPVALKATKDITVYKYVVPYSINGYVTACRNTKVKLNATLKPNTVFDIRNNYKKYCIEGGAIHACTTTIDSGFNCTCLKAIIKKGTTYYVQDDLREVAAAELYITDEVVTDEVTTPDMGTIISDYFAAIKNNPEFANKNGVHVGDYMLSDKTFVSSLDDFDHDKAIGIVAFFDRKDNPVVIALNNVYLPWLTDDYAFMRNNVQSNIMENNTIDDFDGKKHTYDIVNSEDYNPEKFKALAYCANYQTKGTEKGDWYLGAIGEVIKIAQNMGVINAAIKHTGVGNPLKFEYMWTSSERTWYGLSYAWNCRLNTVSCGSYCGGRCSKDCVRPLFKFIS